MNNLTPLVAYGLRVGVGLMLEYACYLLLLRRLTFYNATRAYLLSAALLSFIIPLLDTGALWPAPAARYAAYMTDWGSALEAKTPPATIPHLDNSIHWGWLIQALYLAGAAVMSLRLLFQAVSLYRLRRGAILRHDEEGTRVYDVRQPILPFSFGHAIYVHGAGYGSEDLARIIRHEKAHIQGGHTLDILCFQVLVVLQWWNPAAWLLDRAVRQNLEFLADHTVLEEGADRRLYQYLLLKVSGTSVPVVSTALNFSPLKTRIAMMNKQRSPKWQLARFLFSLPILLLLLAAFGRKPASATQDAFHYAGFIVDAGTLQPLEGVAVTVSGTIKSTVTDRRGYFEMDIPLMSKDEVAISANYTKDGYKAGKGNSVYGLGSGTGNVVLVGMIPAGLTDVHGFRTSTTLRPEDWGLVEKGDAEAIQKVFDQLISQEKQSLDAKKVIAASTDIYFVSGGMSYVTNGHGYAALSGVVDLVIVDDTLRLTGEEVNRRYKREQLSGTNAAYGEGQAKQRYGTEQALFAIYLKK